MPGVAKTTLSKTFAQVLGSQYQRIQFTPDLLPSDVTGTYIFDRKTNEFVLRKGPIFCQVLLADEINRAPAKTQSALLEAMQEIPGDDRGHDAAAAAAVHGAGDAEPGRAGGRLPAARGAARPLPAARSRWAIPGRSTRWRCCKLHSQPIAPVPQVFTPDEILDMQAQAATTCTARTSCCEYIVDLAEASRKHPDVALGASPRASLCLLRCARARALLDGRHYFTHEDVQAMALGVLGHRLIMRPEAEVEGKTVKEVVRDIVESVPVLVG